MAKFQQISPISISKPILETIKIEQSDNTNNHKYYSKYHEIYDTVFDLFFTGCKLNKQKIIMILQVGFSNGIKDEYWRIVSLIESE